MARRAVADAWDEVDQDVGQEDHGWYLAFRTRGATYNFVVGYRHDGARWIGWLERSTGLPGLLFGARTRDISAEAALAIHCALSEAR